MEKVDDRWKRGRWWIERERGDERYEAEDGRLKMEG
jgi:hypothetical protein